MEKTNMISNENYTRSKLIEYVSSKGDIYGSMLIECMDRFDVYNTQQLTIEMLQKFIKERGL